MESEPLFGQSILTTVATQTPLNSVLGWGKGLKTEQEAKKRMLSNKLVFLIIVIVKKAYFKIKIGL